MTTKTEGRMVEQLIVRVENVKFCILSIYKHTHTYTHLCAQTHRLEITQWVLPCQLSIVLLWREFNVLPMTRMTLW